MTKKTLSVYGVQFSDKCVYLRFAIYVFCMMVLIAEIIFLTSGSIAGDEASQHVLAHEILETHSLFPATWYSSTGVFFMGMEVPIAFFSLFFEDQILCRILATFVGIIIALASYLFAGKIIFKNSAIFLAFFGLFTAYSFFFSDMILYQQAYLKTIVIMLFSLCFFIRATFSDETEVGFEIRERKWFVAFVLFCLPFASTNIVIFQSTIIPLFISTVIYYLLKKYDTTVSIQIKNGDVKKVLCILSILILLSIAGIVIQKTCIAPITNVPVSQGTRFQLCGFDEIPNNFLNVFKCFFIVFGVTSETYLLSLHGLLQLTKAAICVSFCIVFPILAFRNYKNEPAKIQFFYLFSAIHFFEIFIMMVFCKQSFDLYQQSKYIISSIFLLFLISANYLYNHIISRQNLLNSFFTVSLCIALVLVNGVNFVNIVETINSRNGQSSLKNLCDYLIENDLKLGYTADFTLSKQIPVFTNFRTEMNNVSLTEQGLSKNFFYLDTTRTYDPDYYYGDTFFLFTGEIEEKYLQKYGEPIEQKVIDGYNIWVYDYNLSQNSYGGVYDEYIYTLRNTNPDDNIYDGSIDLEPGDIMHGPYSNVDAGEYTLLVNMAGLSEKDSLTLSILVGKDTKHMADFDLHNGANEFDFSLSQDASLFQTYVHNSSNELIHLTGIKLEEQ